MHPCTTTVLPLHGTFTFVHTCRVFMCSRVSNLTFLITCTALPPTRSYSLAWCWCANRPKRGKQSTSQSCSQGSTTRSLLMEMEMSFVWHGLRWGSPFTSSRSLHPLWAHSRYDPYSACTRFFFCLLAFFLFTQTQCISIAWYLRSIKALALPIS